MCVDAEQQKVPPFSVPVTYFLLFCSKSILHVSLLSDAEGSGGLYKLVSQTPLLTGFLLVLLIESTRGRWKAGKGEGTIFSLGVLFRVTLSLAVGSSLQLFSAF